MEILGYVNRHMCSDAPMEDPTLSHVELTIQRGLFALPALPERYWTKTPTPTPAAGVTAPVASTNPTTEVRKTSGVPQRAPPEHHVTEWHDKFKSSGKSIQKLKALPANKRPKAGRAGFICMAYHLHGICYDNYRFSKTHRQLNDAEKKAMQLLVDDELNHTAAEATKTKTVVLYSLRCYRPFDTNYTNTKARTTRCSSPGASRR